MRIIYMEHYYRNAGDTFLNGDFVNFESEVYQRKVFRYAFYPYDQGYAYHEPGFSCELLILGEIRFDHVRKFWIKTLAYYYEEIESTFFARSVSRQYGKAVFNKRVVTSRLISKQKGSKIFYESFAKWPFEWLYTDSDQKMAQRFESRMNKIVPRLIEKYKRLDEKEYNSCFQKSRAVG